ncbi:MAG: hypothetical protein ACRYFK_10420 [Janthinobacterium lividum]
MQRTEAFIDGTSVIFSNKNAIDFKAKILKILRANEILIVLPHEVISATNLSNNNVYAFSLQGDFLWRLETKETEFAKYTVLKWSVFIDAFLHSDGNLILLNWCDFAFRVDINTGRILESFQTR